MPPACSSDWVVAVAGSLALAAAVGIGRFAFTPLLPMMQDDAGLSVIQGGWLASANYVGYLMGALWAMMQSARAEHAIRAALIVTALATAAMAYVDGLFAWLLLRTLAGVASAWALIHVTSWCVERLAPLRKPLLSGAVFAGVGAGIMLAGGLCLLLMRIGAGAEAAWLVLGLIGLAIAAVVWPVLGVSASAKRGPIPADRFRWSGDALRLVLCYGAFGLGYIIPATFVPAMARQVVQDPSVFGWAWPVFGFAAAISTLFAARLMRALGNRKVWRLGAFVMALGVVAPLVLPGLAGIVVAAVLVGGTFMVTTMAGIQEAREVAGPFASVLVAALTAAFAAGQIIGPLLVSVLVNRSGFSEALVLAFGVLMASVVALGFPRRAGVEMKERTG